MSSLHLTTENKNWQFNQSLVVFSTLHSLVPPFLGGRGGCWKATAVCAACYLNL